MENLFFIHTFRLDANIGKGYNEHIKHLPDDSVIVITDSDTNFLLRDFGKQIHDIAETKLDEFGLIGAVVNRVGGLHQCYNEEFSNNHDMRHHTDIARKIQSECYGVVEETTGVAGCFMMFRKSTWQKVGGFKEGTIKADTFFNKAIRIQGHGKIGLAKGVYLYHCYRIENTINSLAKEDNNHLYTAFETK